nr:hypothetical protein [Tanacetum cinerariifolium]
MTGNTPPSNPPKKPFDKVYLIASIMLCTPTPFDLEKLNYNSWSALFRHFCKTYDAHHHLDALYSSSTSTSTAPIDLYHDTNDSLVVMWMYKDARVVQLDNEIHNMAIM